MLCNMGSNGGKFDAKQIVSSHQVIMSFGTEYKPKHESDAYRAYLMLYNVHYEVEILTCFNQTRSNEVLFHNAMTLHKLPHFSWAFSKLHKTFHSNLSDFTNTAKDK